MTAWLLQALLGSTILGAVVVLVRPWVLHRFGPRMAYCLWLLPVVRLVLPPMPAWTLHNSTVAAFREEATEVATLIAPQGAWVGALVQVVAVLWAAGALVYFGRGLFAYVWFMQRAGAAVVGPGETIDGVAVRASAFVSGPVAAGIWKRRIFLPLNFQQGFDPDQRSLALAHERAHHRRHDIAWNFVALVAVSIHWFNPLAHYAYRLFRLDQELACDRDVVAASATSPQVYGKLIARAARIDAASPVCALSKADLVKQRLMALARPAGLSPRRAAVALVPVVIVALAATAPINVGRVDVAAVVSAVVLQAPVVLPASATEHVSAADAEAASRPHRRRAPAPGPIASQPAEPEPPVEVIAAVEEDRTSAAYLARRRAAGLLNSRSRMENPAQAARDRGRPVLATPSPVS